jgi:DNA-binding SARP family transcriptional activator
VRSSLGLVEFRVLGPVDVLVEGRSLPLPAGKPRALLAVLLLNRNHVVSAGRLIDDLWGDAPPETAPKALQVYVSQLRKAIGADRVLTKTPGYSIRVEDGELDLDRFELLVGQGTEKLDAGEAEQASRTLAQALELWRGPALSEFESEQFGRDAGARLEESRLAATEERIDADLALGRHAAVISDLEQLVAREPFRERLRGQLMLALYRSGRQAEALDVYRRTRETLVDELGIEPSEGLQELERAILQHDESLEPTRRRPRPTAGLAEPVAPAAAGSSRRTLVVLAVVVLLALAAGGAALALALRGGGSSTKSDHELRAFVSKLENFLVQSSDGRREVAAAIDGTFKCRLAPAAAVERLNRVQDNRQSLLDQLAALMVPDDAAAARSADWLQRAVHASIAADWHYRDWLRGRRRCGPPDQSPELRAALATDRRATQAKRTFLAAFNPLARRFDQKAWMAGEF